MLNNIKKDFLLTKKWLTISLIYSVVVVFLMNQEKNRNVGFFVYFLVPFFFAQLPLGKILSLEDNQDTRDFLKRMPYKSYVRVASRYLFIAILLVFSILVIAINDSISTPECEIADNVGMYVMLLLGFSAYFLFELILFYYKSYHLAQNSVAFLAFGAMGVTFISDRIGVNIGNLNLHRYVAIMLLAALDIILFAICCGVESRDN